MAKAARCWNGAVVEEYAAALDLEEDTNHHGRMHCVVVVAAVRGASIGIRPQQVVFEEVVDDILQQDVDVVVEVDNDEVVVVVDRVDVKRRNDVVVVVNDDREHQEDHFCS